MDLKRERWQDVPLFSFVKAVAIADVDTVLDVGAGIRPQTIVACKRHICMEPHGEYAAILESNFFEVIRSAAPGGFGLAPPNIDSVVMLDVIEHMTRDEGIEAIRIARTIARRQVIVFTPLGFLPQSGDAWGMHGDYWQAHRSGWTPADFAGWRTISDSAFAPTHGAFLAIWNAP